MNIGHLVMGIAFLGLVGVWAIIQSDLVEGADVRWLLPVPWVLAGIAGLLATTLTGKPRVRHHTRPAGSTRATTCVEDDTARSEGSAGRASFTG